MADNLLDLELATPGLSVATPDIAKAEPGEHLAVVPEDYPPGGMPQPGLVGGGALDMGTLWEDYKIPIVVGGIGLVGLGWYFLRKKSKRRR